MVGAGVIQGFDNRDSRLETSGLYQGLSYIAGISGGSLVLSSIVGNNYPTVSSLRDNLWKDSLKRSFLLPGVAVLPAITRDIFDKKNAKFRPTLVDLYGRLLAYQFIDSNDGGVSTTLSSAINKSNFAEHNAPLPIYTSLGIEFGSCLPTPDAIQYEFSPFEFGSWDKSVSTFTPTKYLGTNLSNGLPQNARTCVQNYDNLGYITATSSNIFPLNLCTAKATDQSTQDPSLIDFIQSIVNTSHPLIKRDVYATFPNPFQNYAPATAISSQEEIYLVDGGAALQNNPIWPFIQSTSRVSVLLVNDNSADTLDNYPNGTEILTTYLVAKAAGLSRMPYIPPVSTFVSRGLNRRATFFGCGKGNRGELTIVYLPNTNLTTNTGISSEKGEFRAEETDAAIRGGVDIARQGGYKDWAVCLGCALVMKTGETLPEECKACFQKYCFDG